MDRKKAETVIGYYYQIPEMIQLLQRERSALEGQYNALGAANMDGMPKGSEPGKPVESLAIALGERGASDRCQEIDDKIQELTSDAAQIRSCMDDVNGRYKRLLTMRYAHRYSWAKIAVCLEAPDSTARHWHATAVQRLGEALDKVPAVDALWGRASRARV